MAKFWKYYKYYFCNLWKKPLYWILVVPMIYVQYEERWEVQALIYTSFVLLVPLAVAAQRTQQDIISEEIEKIEGVDDGSTDRTISG